VKRAFGFVVLAVLHALVPGLRADDQPPAPVTDPAAVRQAYHAIVAQPQFHETNESLGDLRWTDWLSQWLTHLVSRFQDFKYANEMSGFARLLVYLLAALAIAGAIYVLMRLSRRKRESAADEIEELPPGKAFLSPRQYEKRLSRALEDRDWHGAWLAAWLQLLARLENRHFVEADRSRTNREYLAQLRARTLPPAALPLIARLVDDYDRFIYGLRTIDEDGWRGFRERIDEVTLMLNLRDRVAEEPA
jgi:hypothetical protein